MKKKTNFDPWPQVDPGVKPVGARILVQLRSVQEKTAEGIYLPNETKEAEKWNTQVGKVISTGPLAYKDRRTMEPFEEGAWCETGMFVRVPKHGADKFEVEAEGGQKVLFGIFDDTNVIGQITGDPLAGAAAY
jgi:co-chaperonin GroES (HSP10)